MHTVVAIILLYTSINKFSDYVMYAHIVLGLMHVFSYTDKVLTPSFTLHEMNSYLPTYNQSLWSRFCYICFIFLFVGTLLFSLCYSYSIYIYV